MFRFSLVLFIFFSTSNFSDKVFSVLLPLGRKSSDAISHSWHVFVSKKAHSYIFIYIVFSNFQFFPVLYRCVE